MTKLHSKYGPSALITGASSGIGAEFAHQLAGAGFDLILVARRRQKLEVLAAELRTQFGVQVDIVGLDLSQTGAVDELVKQTLDGGAPDNVTVVAIQYMDSNSSDNGSK